MAIKVTTPETKQDVNPFPKLMKWDDALIMVFGSSSDRNEYYVYNITTGLFSTCFEIPGGTPPTDYNEPITIQNA